MAEQLSFNLELSKPKLTATRAGELLTYNPETGALTWKVSRGKAEVGKEAGSVWRQHRSSYRQVTIDGIKYFAHRVCFLLHFGAWVEGEIDHIDGNGLNNRISNLRAVTRAMNARNHPRQVNNTSGTTGVYWNHACRKWQANIGVAGRLVHLGLFHRLEQAVEVRKLAERHYGYHENHGREQLRRAA